MVMWGDMRRELDRWVAAGRKATLWWRDDDAVAPTPALDRLLGIAQGAGAPIVIAAIPASLSPDLPRRLAEAPTAAAVQHGWTHANHAPPGRPKAELGPDRPAGVALGELARGALALDRAFGRDGWVRALVPPHNRIAPGVIEGLALAGYVGLSTYRARRAIRGDIAVVNTHCDIMDWTATRGFVGEAAALGLIRDHLAARREGGVDADEPTGLLTHHLAHDEPAWAFVTAFAGEFARHPAIEWMDGRRVFAAGRA